MVVLPDGTRKLEHDLTEQDLENMMMKLLKKGGALDTVNKNYRKKTKKPR